MYSVSELSTVNGDSADNCLALLFLTASFTLEFRDTRTRSYGILFWRWRMQKKASDVELSKFTSLGCLDRTCVNVLLYVMHCRGSYTAVRTVK